MPARCSVLTMVLNSRHACSPVRGVALCSGRKKADRVVAPVVGETFVDEVFVGDEVHGPAVIQSQ